MQDVMKLFEQLKKKFGDHKTYVTVFHDDREIVAQEEVSYNEIYFNTIEEALREKERYEKILSDYSLTVANFREACFVLAMLKGEGRKERRTVDDIDKQLKALNIIAEKAVNLQRLIDYEFKNNRSYNEYLVDYYHADYYGECYSGLGRDLLTQDEYDLLKEVLL